jgi:polygalacturonase
MNRLNFIFFSEKNMPAIFLKKCILLLLINLSITGVFAQTYNVLDYNAKPDGKTINTIAIQNAIDAAHKSGGGKVIFPKGSFLTGTLILKSNVELDIQKNATLLGSTDPKDYPKLDLTGTEVSRKTDDNSKLAMI